MSSGLMIMILLQDLSAKLIVSWDILSSLVEYDWLVFQVWELQCSVGNGPQNAYTVWFPTVPPGAAALHIVLYLY